MSLNLIQFKNRPAVDLIVAVSRGNVFTRTPNFNFRPFLMRTGDSAMNNNLRVFRRSNFSAVSVLVLLALLLTGNISYSEPLRDPVEGELVVTLDVENMT